MKLIVFTVVTTLSLITFSQDIIGTWEFYGPEQDKKIDSVSLELAKKYFSDFKITLNEDGSYSSYGLGKQETGFYTYNRKKGVLTFASSDGRMQEIKVIKLEGQFLTIKISKNNMVLKRKED